LHIFEPRYRQLTADLIKGTVPERRFGVIGLTPSAEIEIDRVEQLQPVGCASLLREAKSLPDGRFDVVTTGERRFRLLDIDTSAAPYLVGSVEWLADEDFSGAPADKVSMLCEAARAAHRRYCGVAWQPGEWKEPPDDVPIDELAYVLAADCLLTFEDRQKLLEDNRPLHRLRTIGKLLSREAGIMSTLRAVPAPPPQYRTPFSQN
jgi:Lon protease-like protein